MVYISRKIIYPIFLLVFTIVFFSIIYLSTFSQALKVDNSSIDFYGQEVILKVEIENISNRVIDDAQILVKMSEGEKSKKIPVLNPNDKNFFEITLPFSSDLKYDVYILSPFNKTIYFPFELEQSTVNPVSVKVQIDGDMIIGEEYDLTYTLCNESQNNLHDVYWITQVEGDYFENFNSIVQTVDLDISECRNLYILELTPIKQGQARIIFKLKVGGLESESEKIINIMRD